MNGRALRTLPYGHGFCSFEMARRLRAPPNHIACHDATELFMIEFAAGILVGGSVGAVIMGALLSQVRRAPGVRNAAAMQSHAAMQAPRHLASRSARHARLADSLPVLMRTRQLAFARTRVH